LDLELLQIEKYTFIGGAAGGTSKSHSLTHQTLCLQMDPSSVKVAKESSLAEKKKRTKSATYQRPKQQQIKNDVRILFIKL